MLTITIMNRPSTSLPEPIRAVLRKSLDLRTVPRVPVYIHSSSHHLLFDTTRLSHHHYHPPSPSVNQEDVLVAPEATRFSLMPEVGKECWLVLHHGHRFLGKVVKVAQYQATQVLLLVAHIRSPAILSIAVPYEFWQGKDRTWSLWGLLAPFWLHKHVRKVLDNGHALPGKLTIEIPKSAIMCSLAGTDVAIDPLCDSWEIDNQVQADYDLVEQQAGAFWDCQDMDISLHLVPHSFRPKYTDVLSMESLVDLHTKHFQFRRHLSTSGI